MAGWVTAVLARYGGVSRGVFRLGLARYGQSRRFSSGVSISLGGHVAFRFVRAGFGWVRSVTAVRSGSGTVSRDLVRQGGIGMVRSGRVT